MQIEFFNKAFFRDEVITDQEGNKILKNNENKLHTKK